MSASKDICTLLSPFVGNRVYPLFVLETIEKLSPYIVYQIISTQPEKTIEGTTGHEWAQVQIDVYHHNYDKLLSLASDVIDALNTIKPSEYGGCQYLFDDGLYRAIIEYSIWQIH